MYTYLRSTIENKMTYEYETQITLQVTYDFKELMKAEGR